MAEGKHTPGPWRLSGPDMFGDFTVQPATEELAIAAVVNGKMWRMGGQWGAHIANARLIAAAPEMFEALANSRETLVQLRDSHLDHVAAVVRALVQKRIEQIDAALAQATARHPDGGE